MKFERAWRFWLASDPSGSRPTLAHVNVERIDGSDSHGLAIAANGFVLAVVPVTLEGDDVPGLVRADLFTMAARMPDRGSTRGKKRAEQAHMTLGADRVTLADDSTHLRSVTYGAKDLPPFPDWRRLVPTVPTTGDVALGEVGIDSRYLGLAGEALGVGRGISGVRLTFTGQHKPILIERAGRFDTATVEPPYVIVMPMNLTTRLRQQTERRAS